jgi:predicted ArsR family transcriptional regulator
MRTSENPSRQKIIYSLKKADGMTVPELSREVGITQVAVRQHLLRLKKKGLVHNTLKRTGKGRPVHVYGLTERAENIFPKAYAKLISDVLRAIEQMGGEDKVESIFRARKDMILKDRIGVLSELSGIRDKVYTMAEMLNQDGYMVELDKMSDTGKGYSLKQYNCPISEISRKYDVACRYELELYRGLLGQGVRRTECISDGNVSCTYYIPA